jgi:hypothetical protein
VLKNVVITEVRTAWYACLRRSDLSAGTRKIEGGGVVAALAEQLGGGDHPARVSVRRGMDPIAPLTYV